jgi:PAS domain S-box-containing protein
MIKGTTLEGIDQAISLPENTSVRATRLTTYFWLLIVIWTIIIIGLLVLDFLQIEQTQQEMAKTEARSNFNKDQAFRFWSSKHGGVYVPINSRTPQNPFLSHVPERDITTPSGKALTLMNPAYMLRQMLEEYEDQFGIRGHITSLKHYRPETAPDEWERSMLMAFDRGDKEVLEFTEIEGTPYLRLMQPMITKKSCLKCHAKQGYKVGDVRGGVSVSVPMSFYLTNQRKMFMAHAFGLGLVWLLGIAGIGMATRGLKDRIRARDKAETELQKAHDSLEIRVEERTAELKKGIAERKRVEEVLRESEAQKAAILDGISTNLAFVNEDLEILWANKISADSVNRNVDEIIGKKCYELWADPNAPCDDCPTAKAFQTKKTEQTIIHSPDGRVWEEKGEPVFDEKGGLIGVLEIAHDITEKAQAEEALRESEEKYRSMMESMKDPIYICSPDFRVEYMNTAMIRRTGRDATGENCFKALHDLDEKCPRCMHDKAQQGEYFESEIVSPKDNHSYHVSNSPIIHGDGSISKMTVYRDTTGLKKLETQLQQAQKMEAIGTLAGGIAHDFNNILGGIIGYAELAKMKAPEGSKVITYLDKLIKSSNRAAALIKQILTISRQHKQEQRPVQVRYIVNEALELLRATLPTTIEIRKDLVKDTGIVNADPTQMHQVIMNLGTNAGQAMQEDGGVLEVSLANVESEDLSAEKHLDLDAGSYLRLTVSDTGYGMTSEIMERIFDPYFTTKDIGEGTGLGLSVAQGIIKAHGGTITVYSEMGKGTTFHVYLPLILEEEREEKKSEGPLPTGNERILFIDDERALIEIGGQMLERLGYEVVTKRNSVQALELFRAEPDRFDLVITDMTMPDMTGDKLAQELMKIRPQIPIILCTGHSILVSEEKAKEIGIKAFVMKPLVMRNLAETVRKVLDAGRSEV